MAFIAALSGILTGEIGRWVTKGIDIYAAGKEHQRNIELLKLQHENAIDLEDVKNFGKAQSNVDDPITISDRLNICVFNGLSILAVCTQAATKAVRPILTACSVSILFYAYDKSTVAQQAVLSEELIFTSSAVIKYWFGYREDMRKKAK